MSAVSRLVAALLLAPIRAYRRLISPAVQPRCRYYPSCSRYAEEAITELGPARGTLLAGWRLLRCNPFSRGGIDEIADRRWFRSHGSSGAGVGARAERGTGARA